MLSPRDQELLQRELAEATKINKRANGTILPEEEKLLEKKITKDYPAGGLHVHDEDNPLGMHRHFLGEKLDGAHVHTIQNPGGEHYHGELKGRALTDGAHYHGRGGLGYHHHDRGEDDTGKIVPQKHPKLR